MKTIISIMLISVLAGPVAAMENGDAFSSGDSHGPRSPRGQTEGYASTVAQAKPVKPSWSQEPWSYEAQSPKGWSDPRPTELSEQVARNTAANRRSYDQLVEDGGCNADVVPFTIASYCNGAVFGDPMGSKGGD